MKIMVVYAEVELFSATLLAQNLILRRKIPPQTI